MCLNISILFLIIFNCFELLLLTVKLNIIIITIKYTSCFFRSISRLTILLKLPSSEVHAINEQTELLIRLVNDIGTKLKTWAVCSGARRLRYGIFTPDQALVVPQWRLDPVVEAMQACRTTQAQHRLARSPTLTPLPASQLPAPRLSASVEESSYSEPLSTFLPNSSDCNQKKQVSSISGERDNKSNSDDLQQKVDEIK